MKKRKLLWFTIEDYRNTKRPKWMKVQGETPPKEVRL